MDPIVIVGSGLAGYGLARELRRRGVTVPVSVVTADDGAAYSKPNLSTALTAGKAADAIASATAEAMAAQLAITVHASTRVRTIDRASRTLRVDSAAGEHQIRYAQLVLALGADPIRLPIGGDASNRILSVNDLQDYRAFRAALEGKRRVAILGAGLIGCEFANDLANAGIAVDVIDIGAWPLGRLLPQEAGAAIADALGRKGVSWHFGRHLNEAVNTNSGIELRFRDGGSFTTDLVLSAVGLRPRTTLAKEAGLDTGRGIRTNALLKTSDPDIFAIGDCAETHGEVRPYVMPITHGIKALAATLSGTPTAVDYPAMPVTVKTPALPLVVCPPPPAASGAWAIQGDAESLIARFEDADGRMLGFGLTGTATKQRTSLAAELGKDGLKAAA